MKDSNLNIQVNYLHRDEGNYKMYGSIIFSNKYNLDIGNIEQSIRKKLIDEQFFYPKAWGVKLQDYSHAYDFFMEWYEYEGINFTEQSKEAYSDISIFLFNINKNKNCPSL